MPPVGFILLTHNKPVQICRLVDRLTRLFDHPPIQCHHDFSKCALDRSQFAANIQFVEPHLQTGWAQFNVVEATVRAIDQLYRRPDAPEWFVVLSGADYPIKAPDVVIRDLRANGFDAHICLSRLQKGFLNTPYDRKCYSRYTTSRIRLPSLDRHFRFKWREIFLHIPFYTAKTLPFGKDLIPYSGGQWFCGNAKAAARITNYHGTNRALENHLRARLFSEEAYFHTILGNASQLKINSDHWRYVDFSEGKANPKILTTADLPKILASPSHFARKFDIDKDTEVLNNLDHYLGL